MALQAGVNSYISYADADAYMSDRLFASAWDAAGQQTCEKALIMATKRIDALALSGRKAHPGQALQFPRYGCDAVPQAVLDAVCEEALAILEGGESGSARAKLKAEGVQSYSIGALSESFAQGAGVPALQSPEALRLMQPFMGVCEIE